ncbi:MAG: hypothetical protein KJ043_02785 [Anaerolineae bacterium]|nr:hypothetical protein [Anaerolineae bacterium]
MMRIIHILLCKWRMVAYVNGELSPAFRRRMARYIEQYPSCYAEYRRQRELRLELTERIPVFGVSSNANIKQLWLNIEREVAKPRRLSLTSSQFAVCVLMVGTLLWMILLITTVHQSDGATLVITPPTPDNVVQEIETSNPNFIAPTIPPTIVAIATSGNLMVANQARNEQTTTYQNPYPTPRLGE